MPIIVDPDFVPPPPPETVTGIDGILSVTADIVHGGALLVADYTGEDPAPRWVRFRRADGTPVRSGHDAWAPGGVAVAYDGETPLSGPVSWYSEPIWPGGVVGSPSAPAAITLEPPPPSRLWLKSVAQPNLTVLARVATAEETGRALRSSIVPTAGAQLSGGSWDVALGWTGTVGLRTDTEEEYNTLVEVLTSGVLLMQAPNCAGIPDQMYVLPQGDLAARRMSGAETGQGWGFRIWPVSLVQVERPTALDAPLMIPGLSWATTRTDYASWLELRTAVPSWLSLLGGD